MRNCTWEDDLSVLSTRPCSEVHSIHESRPESDPPARTYRHIRPWLVLHACNISKSVLVTVEAQREAGMRPAVITPAGLLHPEDFSNEVPPKLDLSLLTAWNNVRHWRQVLLEADPRLESDLVHAHSFPSGMAGVRNCPCVVYEVDCFVEEAAREHVPGSSETTGWLGRSFRVAEQFVLTRAAAVVVHSPVMLAGAVERGAAPENVFLVPRILDLVCTPQEVASKYDKVYRHAYSRRRSGNLQTPVARLQPIAT